MNWTQAEIGLLAPILQRVQANLDPLGGKHILVLCSAAGELVFQFAESMPRGKVVGLELNPELLAAAQQAALGKGKETILEFLPAEKTRIPLPDGSFDGLVSEFIVFPTPEPTGIGQAEMARVIKPGGWMILTDVIVTRPIPQAVRDDLQAIGLDYLCEGTPADFRSWMSTAGLIDIEVIDLTEVVRKVWEHRRATDPSPGHRNGYSHLLEDDEYGLGKAIYYIYVCGRKEGRP